MYVWVVNFIWSEIKLWIVSLISSSSSSWFLREYIACLWSFDTSSYSSKFLRASKFLLSILFCAFSIPLESILCSIWSSPIPIFSKRFLLLSEIKSLNKSSSKERKNLEYPGSPCLPDLPLSWLSIRLDSCLSVPRICSPFAAITSSLFFFHSSVRWSSFLPPRTISVPLPAILVAIVTIPGLPALAIISASFSWCLAFKIWCGMFLLFRYWETSSDDSTETVPTRTGADFDLIDSISSIKALYFAFFVRKTKSLWSSLIMGRLVGIIITLNPYICWNSTASVSAVPVIPDNLLNNLKKFWNVVEAKVWDSLCIGTFSLHSKAWWTPSLILLPGIVLPVCSSINNTSLFLTR